MQCDSLKPPQRYELIYPVHDGTLIVITPPKTVWDYSGCDSTTKGRHMCRGTRHVCETCLFKGSGIWVAGVILAIAIRWPWSCECVASRLMFVLSPL